MTTKTATKIINSLKKEAAEIEKVRRDIEAKSKKMTALKKAGIRHGKLNCNGKKYFWFIGKMTKGKRTREYVGNSKKKIKKYQQEIDRGSEYKKLEKQIKQINAALKYDYKYRLGHG